MVHIFSSKDAVQVSSKDAVQVSSLVSVPLSSLCLCQSLKYLWFLDGMKKRLGEAGKMLSMKR